MFKRKIKIKILELLDQFPVVGIVGSRQVGKTTLAKELAEKTSKPTIYLDLENPDDLAKLQQPTLFLKNYESYCVIIDEVQRMPNLFPIMRSMVDQHRIPGRFLLLGSASPELIKNSSETLAGRIAFEELHPLQLQEVDGTTNMQQHWLRGGFPDSLQAKNDLTSFRWRRNFIQTYIERDLPLLGLQTDVNRLRDFVTMLAAANGSLLNTDNFARALGVTNPTVKRYLFFLEHAYLIDLLPSFHVNVKKRLVKSPKVYFKDTGILHTLLGINNFSELQTSVAIGHSWEGYVLSQVKAILPDGWSSFFYRTYEGTEADVVLCYNNKPIVTVEIKYTNAPKTSKGLFNSINDLKTKSNFIVTPYADRYPVGENIEVINLNAFLKELQINVV